MSSDLDMSLICLQGIHVKCVGDSQKYTPGSQEREKKKKKTEIGVTGKQEVAKVNRMTQKDRMTQIKFSQTKMQAQEIKKNLEAGVVKREIGVVKQKLQVATMLKAIQETTQSPVIEGEIRNLNVPGQTNTHPL